MTTATKSTGNPIHCTCQGTGQYVVENEDGFLGSLSTHLCPCRLNEEPRHGEAKWWTEETIEEREFQSPLFDKVRAVISRERPVSEDNHRLIRTPENAYHPAMASLEAEFSSCGMTSDMLRDLAKWLTEVADRVDEIDREVS